MIKKKSYLLSCIFYGIIAVLCLLGIKTLYIFFMIFAALCAFYGYLAYKHRNDKAHPLMQKIMDNRNERKQNKRKSDNDTMKSHKQLKAEYKARLNEIENEFNFDYDDDTKTNNANEEAENVSDE